MVLIKIGAEVEVNNALNGIIVQINIKGNSVIYEVQQTLEDDIRSFFVYDWEITSSHSEEGFIARFVK